MTDSNSQNIELSQQIMGPPPVQMKEFEFLIGNWDVSIKNYLPDGTLQSEEKAKWTAEYKNGGRMVIDEFTWVEPSGEEGACSVTLRTFCPATQQWEMTYLFSLQQNVPQFFQGTFVNGEGHFDAAMKLSPENIVLAKISFTDITKDSFEWRMQPSLDGGKTWFYQTICSVTRV